VPNPWLNIPLSDYEGHMSLPSIGQAEMLSSQFASLLAECAPGSVAVIGCAGGNGFDRVSPDITKRIVGIDINRHYIEELSRRYAGRIPGLELHVADIQEPTLAIEPVDLIYAALVFEYVEAEPTLKSLKSICRANGVLAVVLQLPSNSVAALTPSPFTSLQILAPVMHLLSPDAFCAHAQQAGFVLKKAHTLSLPSGKNFALLVFGASPG
jgi:SAM-dependent methyltransferase